MSSLSQVFRNVRSNYARDGIAMAVALLLTPFLFHRLGAAAYGLIVLTGTTNGILRLLDGGLAHALARFVGRDLAASSHESVRRVVNTAFATYIPVGVVAGAAIAAVGPWATTYLGVPADLDVTARLAFGWAGISLTARFWGAAFDGTLRGAQRFESLNAVLILERLLYAVGAVLAVGPLELGAAGVAAALAVSAAVAQVAKAVLALRSVPDLRLSFRVISRHVPR